MIRKLLMRATPEIVLTKPALALLFLLTFAAGVYGQSSRLSMKKGKMRRFAEQITGSVLIVPLHNEKDPEDKALMEAVKKYWKVSKYEFIADKDLEATYEANIRAGKNSMYLIRESYNRRKAKKKDWSFTKYYISGNPSYVEIWGDPYLQFKLPVKAVNKTNPEPVKSDFLYGMMMKHLNREVLYMKDPDKYGRVSRRRLYKGTFEGSLEPYAGRDVLVSRKELDNFMMNLPERKKTPEQEAKFIRYLVKRMKVNPEKIKLVSDDYIKKAISSEDKKVLIYTGFSLFRGEDAAMLRRIDPHRSNRIAFNITFTIGLLTAIAAFMVVLTFF
jgi:hypothetical protein